MLVSIVVFAITLLVLVVSHELGHFLVARKFGVKVLEFGFGIPPKIWSRMFGETRVSVNALPIGGFVRLLGEDEADKIVRSDPRSFAIKPVGQRILIVGAGVVVNLVLSWMLFYIVLINQNWRIIYPTLESAVVVAELSDNFPAKEAGIRVGEKITKVDSVQIENVDTAVRLIRSQANNQVSLTLSDVDGKTTRVVEVIPKLMENGEGRIGVAFSPVPFKIYQTPLEKFFSGITYSFDITRLTFQGLGRLVSDVGQGNYKPVSASVAGPIQIGAVAHNFVSNGWQATIPYLWFVGVISLTLTIFNSLPFPALDGGRILFMLVELITRRKINANLEKWVHTVGMVILLTLMVLVALSDIYKFLV